MNDVLTRIVTEPVDHHDPLGRSDYLSIEHVERYRFAARRLAAGQRVLDIACGAGYGTAMLAARGCHVTGADCDERAVAIARSGFPSGDFECADALALPFADETFDAVVTFETIEHVLDGARFLRELRRVLRRGGTLICSTPNVAYTAHPACHVREYEPAGFFALMEASFGATERHAQYLRPFDRLGDLYRWHVKPRLLGIADAIGVRPAVRRLRGRADSIPSVPAAEPSAEQRSSRVARLAALIDGPAHAVHGVRPLAGEGLLRIMIAVAQRAPETSTAERGA